MRRCIYCQEGHPAERYTKAEHVMPQSFGRFRDNFTLRGVVCDACNQHFGNSLELYLGRDTMEGQMRFRHGLKSAEEFKSVGDESRLIVQSTEGKFSGCYMQRYYSHEKHDITVRPLPQVGFMLTSPPGYVYFLLDAVPTQAELDERGFDRAHARPIVALEIEPGELKKRLAERGIEFNHGGELTPDFDLPTIGCEVEATVDHIIFRAVAKIAFNYLAFWEGAEFMLHEAFDPMRRYIRRGEVPTQKLMHMDEMPILADEAVEGSRRLGHLVTANWTDDGDSIVAQVSLFNWMTYRVCLAPDFAGPRPNLTRGHFFNVPGQEILELGTRPTRKQ
jgi:hypothetical protein